MIEGVTRPFGLEPPHLTSEEVAEAARLFEQGVVDVYKQFSPDNLRADNLSIDVSAGEEEIGFEVSRVGTVIAATASQTHSWGSREGSVVTRDDGNVTGPGIPERERTIQPEDSTKDKLKHIKEQSAARDILKMTQPVYPEEMRKLFALIMTGNLAGDTGYNQMFPGAEQ